VTFQRRNRHGQLYIVTANGSTPYPQFPNYMVRHTAIHRRSQTLLPLCIRPTNMWLFGLKNLL